ncbi:MAG: glycosyltransferase, partial [Candidatus Binataceae bacterium]
ATLAACLSSIARLNYPAYETIVIDDGSIDATAAIARNSGMRTLSLEHCGLSFARNAGIVAAHGAIVAFIDADAEADPDWLYHLVETITRREAAAVGGGSFPPPPASDLAAALACAPGLPREVRIGDDELEQVCGCSMAVDKAKIGDAPYFDHAFAVAGDDVDFSWRLREQGARIAYAPAASVIHQPRATAGAYLRQQLGYGHAEGLLYRKYPRRTRTGSGVYGGWFRALFSSGMRVYYGAFGRGLFQTLYAGETLAPIAQFPLTIHWVIAAGLLMIAGPFSPVFGVLGLSGIAISIATAATAAMLAPSRQLTMRGRIILAYLCLLGPLVRSYERTRVIWSFNPDVTGAPSPGESQWHGRLTLTVPPDSGMVAPAPERLMEAVRDALIRRGAAVAVTDGYEPYDLQIRVAPLIRVPLLILEQHWELGVGWRIKPAPIALPIAAAIVIIGVLGALPLGSLPLAGAIGVIAVAAAVVLRRVRMIPALIGAAVADAARQFGLCVTAAGR